MRSIFIFIPLTLCCSTSRSRSRIASLVHHLLPLPCVSPHPSRPLFPPSLLSPAASPMVFAYPLTLSLSLHPSHPSHQLPFLATRVSPHPLSPLYPPTPFTWCLSLVTRISPRPLSPPSPLSPAASPTVPAYPFSPLDRSVPPPPSVPRSEHSLPHLLSCCRSLTLTPAPLLPCCSPRHTTGPTA